MNRERATELLREHGEPRWNELRAARVQKRVLEQLEDEPAPRNSARSSWWLVAVAVSVMAIAVVSLVSLASRTVEQPNEIHFRDGSTIRTHDSARVVSRVVTESVVEVEHLAGRATYDVVPRRERRFTVLVGDVQVQVIGTRFEIARLEDGVHVSVLSGKVQVSRADERLMLAAGEDVTFRDGAEPSQVAAPPETESARAGSQQEHSRVTSKEAPVPSEPVPARYQPDAAELFRQADDARAAGQSERALRLLRQLVREYPRDQRVPLARFTMGRVHAQSGNLEAAAATFESCGATLGGEAMAEAALARSALGQVERARASAELYLERFPQGPRASQMKSLFE